MRLTLRRVPFLVLAGLSPCLSGCPGSLADLAEFADGGGVHVGDGGLTADVTSGGEGGSPGDSGGSVDSAGLGADAGGNPPPPGDAGCGAEIPTTVFTPICAQVGCHNASTQQSGLNLASPINLAALVNRPTVEADGGFLIIDSADPSKSALYTKLTADPPFGLQMPYGQEPLTADQVQCVLDWITVEVGDAGAN